MVDHDPVDELVGGLRTDVPEMTDAAFAAGRTRLRATVVAAEPVPPAPGEDVAPLPSRKKRLLRSPPGKLAASAAAVVVLAAGVLAGQALRTDGNAPVAIAAATLNSAADNINPVDEPIRPDQYRYLATHVWRLGMPPRFADEPDLAELGIAYLQESLHERWLPGDPARACVDRSRVTGNLEWLAGDEEKAEEAGVPLPEPGTSELTMPCDGGVEGWWGTPTAEFMAALPRDPQLLYDRLRQDSKRTWLDPDLAVLLNVHMTLRSGMVPADLRAALYRALALLPGLRITEQVANVDGHRGTAFGISRGGERHELIIDPATGQYIGERRVDESGDMGVPPGTVVAYTSVSNPVVVDAVGETR